MATSYNFPIHESGDTFNGVQFELKVNSAAKDLTDAKITMKIAGKEFTSTAGNFVISDSLNGKFNFKKQMVKLPDGYHLYKISIECKEGDIKTYVTGYWLITNTK
jgi:hypothetical protein